MTTPDDRTARRLRRYVTATAGCAVAGLALAWWGSSGPAADWAVLLGLAAVLTAAELRPIHLVHRDESEALQVEEAFFVPMVFLLAPFEAMVVVAVSVGVASLTWRRGLLKSAFNTAMMTLSFGVGLAVVHGLGLDRPLGAEGLAALLVGGLVFSATSTLLVGGIIALAQGAPLRSVLWDGAGVRLAICLGSLSLGVLVVAAVQDRPLALVAAAVPVIVLQFAYDGALRQFRERRQAEALYAAAGRIRRSVDSAEVRSELLAAAGGLLGAHSARVLHAPLEPPAPGALRVPLDDRTSVEVADRATGGDWTRDDSSRLQALAAVASGALSNAVLYEQLQAVTRSLGEGVLALDAVGRISFVNPAAARLLGWPEQDLLGRQVAAAIDPAGLLPLPGGGSEWVHLPRLRAGETVRLDEYGVTRSDGAVLDVALTASPVLRDGEVVGSVIALRDGTERKALERRLMHQAFHDQLTGLPNRALFLDRLEHARARGVGGQAVLFVDLDRFKTINDSLGHRVGDDVLCTVGSRLVGAVHPGDTVARFGGDEFTVLIEEHGDRAEAVATAERLLRALRAPILVGDRQVRLSASIGIALAEPAGASTDLLAAADIAMYEAKSGGRDRYVVAAADADVEARARLDLETALHRAIEVGELELEYQPVVRTQGEALHGFEALVRWRHPQLGLLPPAQFMPLAEDSGLVLPLGEWVLEQACVAARQWHQRHPGTGAVMAVNLSGKQFQDPGLPERVAAVLARTGLSPALLTLEITETVVMQDSARTLGTLTALRELGVRLAIDDFGTGYSSLSYLKRFPVDTVKIDKSFVDGLATSSVDREIVAAVIRLAGAVGMSTVAEGVETAGQLDQLRLLGCSLVQGYLVCPPRPMAELDRVVGRAAAAGLPVPRCAPDDLPAARPAAGVPDDLPAARVALPAA